MILIGVCVALFVLFLVGFFTSDRSKKETKKYSYKPKYANRETAKSLPTAEEAKNAAQKSIGISCKFLLSAKQHLRRDYCCVVDRSGSMSGKSWKEAEEAIKLLAPQICQFDPDGISLIFFDHDVVKHDNIKSAGQVMELFNQNQPRGSTDLAKALDAAFQDHFDGERGATTILVITDGCPNSKEEAQEAIIAAANALELDEELSISFIQIGKDKSATKYLQHLDDDLADAKFDIVDTITSEEAKNITFNELIARSIYD